MQEYLNVITKNYANFTGRARRREYWMFVLFNFLVTMVLTFIEGLIGLKAGEGATSVGILSGLYALAVLIPSIAVGIRRLHDTGRSGWLFLIGLIPLVGALVLIYFYVQDSVPGTNKWGPNPKGEGSDLPQNAAANW